MNKVILLLLLIFLSVAGLCYMQSRGAGDPSPSRPSERVSEHPPTSSDSTTGVYQTADLVYIEKEARRLTLFRKGKPIRTYRVALGFAPKGKKTTDGDGRTPEGRYIIDRRKRNSRFHRALHISYPNADDRRQAAERGVSPGGDIMIHGLLNGLGRLGKAHLLHDWTLGCIALTNEEVEEVWRLAPVGTPVEIVP